LFFSAAFIKDRPMRPKPWIAILAMRVLLSVLYSIDVIAGRFAPADDCATWHLQTKLPVKGLTTWQPLDG
jgi:hypothetical protein